MKKTILLSGVLAFGSLGLAQAAHADRDYISMAGSSTVYPFATVTAERFGRTSSFKTPTVESTGTGGGFKLLCSGVGPSSSDIANASRPIKASELELCQSNGVNELVEIMVGFDGIVLANSTKSPVMNVELKELYLALAKTVPAPSDENQLIANPYKTWQQINPKLPNVAIQVLGPPPTSGTRDAFVELVMEAGCSAFPVLKEMKKTDSKKFSALCQGLREDGAFIEAGENDNLIVQKLVASPEMYGIFGFSYLEENRDKVQGAQVAGISPSYENISSANYPVSRSMFMYVKKAHVDVVPGLKEFLAELTSKRAMGEEGYMAEKGMIPLPESLRQIMADRAKTLPAVNLN